MSVEFKNYTLSSIILDLKAAVVQFSVFGKGFRDPVFGFYLSTVNFLSTALVSFLLLSMAGNFFFFFSKKKKKKERERVISLYSPNIYSLSNIPAKCQSIGKKEEEEGIANPNTLRD